MRRENEEGSGGGSGGRRAPSAAVSLLRALVACCLLSVLPSVCVGRSRGLRRLSRVVEGRGLLSSSSSAGVAAKAKVQESTTKLSDRRNRYTKGGAVGRLVGWSVGRSADDADR